MTKFLKLIISFFLISSCSNNDLLISNLETELKNEIYSIGTTGLANKNLELDSLGYKTCYKRRNDTLFLLAKKDENGYSKVAWIHEIKKQTSNLNCERIIAITLNEITFSFCYTDVISLLDKFEERCCL